MRSVPRIPFSRPHPLCFILIAALAFAGLFRPARAATFTVDGNIRLDAISASIPSTGAHHIRFTGAGYLNPGSLTLGNNGSDSLIFERAVPADSALRIDNVLMHLQGQKGTVVFRGLALKLGSHGTLFDTNQSGNRHLVFDSCTVLGDTVGTGKALSWGGDGTSRIDIKNSQFAYMGSMSLSGASAISVSNSMFVSTGPIALTGDSVALSNDLLNLSGVVSATVSAFLGMRFNTVNRAQFLLDGTFTAKCEIRNNYFANPPAKNNLAQGGAQKYVAFFKGGSFLSDSMVTDNVRYSTWDGFDYFPPGSAMFTRAGNAAIPPAKDSTVPWDWKIAGDNAHGAWNGPNPLPDYNVLPGTTEVGLDLPDGRASFRVAASAFPRLMTVGIGTVSYASPTLPDTVRSWYRKDTLLVLGGSPATVLGLSLPSNANDGSVLVYYRNASGFSRVVADPAKGGLFPDPLPGAREFVPALGGQNTFRGSNVTVTGPAPVNPLLVFPSVIRAGKTTFSVPPSAAPVKRVRHIAAGSQDAAFAFRTDAEGADSIRFGVPQSGLGAPFIPDSLRFWTGGNLYIRAQDSAGKYWGKAPSGKDVQAMLVEKLALGPGADTLAMPQATLISNSAAGHQVRVDSAYHPSSSDFPFLGAFGPALSFSWPGRLPGDTLAVVLSRSDTAQKAYRKEGKKAILVTPLAAEARSLTLPLALADSLKAIFIAREYRVPAGQAIDLGLGPDSVKGLLSDKPGDIALDSAYRPGKWDSTQFRILAARKLILDSLAPRGPYTLVLSGLLPVHSDSVKAFFLEDTVWKPTTVTGKTGTYAIQVSASARAALVAETLPKEEQVPVQPAQAALAGVQGDQLVIAPRLTAAERAVLRYFRADLLSLDVSGAVRVEKSGLASVDSTVSLGLASDRLYAYRVIYATATVAGRSTPDTAWIPLADKQPSAALLEAAVPHREAKYKYLIGFPFDATFEANVQPGFATWPPKAYSLSELTEGKWVPKKKTSDAGKPLAMPRGAGFLFAASEPFQLKIGTASFPGLRPDTVPLSVGWNLFANPFPLPQPAVGMGVDTSAVSLPLALKAQHPGTGQKSSPWVQADTLHPYEGYLIYAFRPTKLVFDPAALASAAAKPSAAGRIAAGRSGAAPNGGEMRLDLSGPSGSQSAVIYRSGPYRPTPYMPPPGDGEGSVQFRVGGNGGWLFQKWDRLDSLEVPIEIAASAGTGASLSLSLAGGEPGATRMLDWQTGTILDEAGMAALPPGEGVRHYTLLHGKAVDPGTAAFARALPSAFSVAQNFPNPFRGTTRIRFSVPALAGRILGGRLKVLSLDGRVVEDQSLAGLTVGTHSLTVGNPSWRPGLYIYEIGIRTERGTLAARKKMIFGGAAE